MRFRMLAPAALLVFSTMPQPAQAQQKGAPETFIANAHALGATGGAGAATIQIDVKRYTPEADRTAVETALRTGGYQGFLAALRKAPQVGEVSVSNRKSAIRWARATDVKNGRRIVIVTDSPVFFVGGGNVDAKPREGYDVAVIEMMVDDVGLGNGSMAAAARVKHDPENGVKIDDYADKPIKLTTVNRKIQ
jgi:hypothetical protein